MILRCARVVGWVAGLAGVVARAGGDGLPRGWYDAPYVRYEAEAGVRGGGAVDRTAFDFHPANTAVEASGRHYVGLPVNGSFVQWTVTNRGEGVTLRFTLPDSPGGAGVAGSLDLYVNGTNTMTVNLGSYWAWVYFVSSNPQNTPGVRPRMRFDELHVGLPAELQPGDVLRIQKNNGDGLEYGVDFVELEDVPAALPQPPGFISVAAHGADGGDANPDTTAFQNAWQAAQAAGTGLYIPPGRYLLTNQWHLGNTSGRSIQGAGIWHTELHFPVKGIGRGGIYVGENTHAIDISHFFMSSVLNERYIVPGVISDYKAFNGVFGRDSRVHHLWITHFETGAWLADEVAPVSVSSNFVFEYNRVRNTYADGLNFSQGTRDSTARYNSFRDNGDDALAVWPTSKQGAPEGRDNVFHHNTVEFTYRAGGIGIFGGSGHQVHHNVIRDGTDTAGIRFTEDFPGYHFENNTGIRVYENTIEARGTSFDLWNLPRGAIEISGAGIRRLYFDHNDLLDSPRHAIQLRGGTNLYFSNTTIRATGLDPNNAPGGAAVRQYDLGGGAAFAFLLMEDIESQPPILKETPAYDLVVQSEFPFTASSTVVVPEGGTASLGVRLSFAPAGVVTVTLARVAGDADLSVTSGAALFFSAANWSMFQPAVFAAADDADVAAGSAAFRCLAVGFGETAVTAIEFEDDVNHPPVAADDAVVTDEDAAAAVAVLANDTDPDAHALAIASATAGAHGAVSHDGTTALYTPHAGFHGLDAFTYVITDGHGGSATARVAVTVNEVLKPNPYRMEIRFPGYDRAEALSNFPVLVRLGPERAGFAYAQFASPKGHDLRFTGEDGALLNYEIESWDTGGVSAVWVQVPRLTNHCRIEASWGSADNLQQPDYATNGAAWGGGYAAVYHAGGAGDARRDSSAGGRHAQAFGNTAADAGLVAAADRFDGDADYVELPSTFALFNGMVPVTVEFWFRADALAPGTNWQTSPVLFQGNGESAWMITLGDSIPADAIGNRVDQGGWSTPVSHAGLATGRWYHCTSTYSPTAAPNWKLHLDGRKVAEASRSGLIGFLTEKNLYGGNNVGTDRWFDGLIDEVRISRETRSTNWVWATWLAVASNTSFAAYGAADGPPAAPPPDQAVLVDFGNDQSYRGSSVANPDSNGNYWNSISSDAYWPNLVDVSNAPTPVALGFDFAPGTDSYNGPSNAVDAAALGRLGGALAAVNDYYVNSRFQLQGLDTGRAYRLTFFGSHKYSDNDATVYGVYRDAAYTSLVASTTLNVQMPGANEQHNSNAVAVLDSLAPQAGGTLYVKFQGAAGGNGYLNAMLIERKGVAAGAGEVRVPGFGLGGGAISISFVGSNGVTYGLQFSTNLLDPAAWQDVLTGGVPASVAGDGASTRILSDTNRADGTRAYRLIGRP